MNRTVDANPNISIFLILWGRPFLRQIVTHQLSTMTETYLTFRQNVLKTNRMKCQKDIKVIFEIEK